MVIDNSFFFLTTSNNVSVNNWVPPDADLETRIEVQIVSLEVIGYLRKHQKGNGERRQERGGSQCVACIADHCSRQLGLNSTTAFWGMV